MKRENDLQVTLADATHKKLKQNLKVRVSSYQKIIITIVPLDIPSRTVISQLGQLIPAGSLNRVPASAGGNGGNVTSAIPYSM